MPTFEELAKSYAEKLASAPDRKHAANEIVRSIEGLVYTGTKESLSAADKRRIVELVRTPIQFGIHIREADNAAYLAMINYVYQKLGDRQE